jgi:asparagine synthase (glutamine-hydrolysing)
MCGIAGVSFKSKLAEQTLITQMASRLQHHGSKKNHAFTANGIGLSHQPLLSADTTLALAIDGTIYNHVELSAKLEGHTRQYSTDSDSESILHAYAVYGLDFLDHLYGMFAFALYDAPRQRLILARDRLGIKPLFLAHVPDGIAFASELKALLPALNAPPTVNPLGLVQFLHQQFNSGSTTILEKVERIAPGEAVIIEAGRITKRWRYWSATNVATLSVSMAEAQEAFDPLMESVVRQHMRSDVPSGLFLSGGVDSALLLGLLTRYGGKPVRTYSAGFPGTDIQDELPPARILAERYHSIHTEIRPSRDELFQRLPLTVWAADDLMRDYATLPVSLLAQRAADDVQVVFSGEGGDEVFAGYRRFDASSLSRAFKNLLHPGSGGFRTSGSLTRHDVRDLLSPTLKTAFHETRSPFIQAWQEAPKHWSSLQRMQYTELRTALPDNLMVKSDRMTASWGLEGRMPFLDHRIVEFGLALPDQLKIHGKIGKYFLKQWGRSLLTEEQFSGKKRGFHVPVGDWLSGDFLIQLGQLLPTLPGIAEWFQPEAIKQLVTDQHQRKGHAARLLFALLQFAIWHRLFIEGSGQRPPPFIDPLEFLMN